MVCLLLLLQYPKYPRLSRLSILTALATRALHRWQIKLESPLDDYDDGDARGAGDPMHLGIDATSQRRTLIKVITSNKYEEELIGFARGVGFLPASSASISTELHGIGGGAPSSGGGVSGGKGGVRGRTRVGVASAAAQRKDAAAVAAIGTGHPKVKELIGAWQRAGRTRADILLLGRSGVGKSRLVNDIVGLGSELTAEGAWHSQTQRIAPFVVVLNGERRGDALARATLEVHVWDTPGLDDEVAYVASFYCLLFFTFYMYTVTVPAVYSIITPSRHF